ncbi:peptidylprolyl isomerase [Dankookia sp. GCM10030260]|uniref:peptidylprolyl isomerase n=1 Tax=Dankookia sp. GCM10030260 TaxID=3273390 RepID=UPI003615E48E
MRVRSMTLAAALLLPLAPAAALAQAPAPTPTPAPAAVPAEDPVLARVDGQPVRLSDVLATAQDVLPADMRDLPPGMLMQVIPADVRRQLVERTITERALTGAARAAGLDKEEAVRRRIQRAEEQELQQVFLAREVAAGVTDSALRARYDQESGKRQGGEEVHARHILLRTEPEAKAALAAIRGGEDFAAVARRLSIDPGAKDGGDLGFFKRSDMVPEFAEAAFAMKPGELSEPVKSPFGWHVIRAEERRAAPVPSFEESRQQLRQQMLQEQVDAVVQRVRATAKVERLDQPAAGGSLLDNAAPPAASPGGARPAQPRR